MKLWVSAIALLTLAMGQNGPELKHSILPTPNGGRPATVSALTGQAKAQCRSFFPVLVFCICCGAGNPCLGSSGDAFPDGFSLR